MSELRLYCDLLLQQVNKIKDSDEPRESAEVTQEFGTGFEEQGKSLAMPTHCHYRL